MTQLLSALKKVSKSTKVTVILITLALLLLLSSLVFFFHVTRLTINPERNFLVLFEIMDSLDLFLPLPPELQWYLPSNNSVQDISFLNWRNLEINTSLPEPPFITNYSRKLLSKISKSAEALSFSPETQGWLQSHISADPTLTTDVGLPKDTPLIDLFHWLYQSANVVHGLASRKQLGHWEVTIETVFSLGYVPNNIDMVYLNLSHPLNERDFWEQYVALGGKSGRWDGITYGEVNVNHFEDGHRIEGDVALVLRPDFAQLSTSVYPVDSGSARGWNLPFGTLEYGDHLISGSVDYWSRENVSCGVPWMIRRAFGIPPRAIGSEVLLSSLLSSVTYIEANVLGHIIWPQSVQYVSLDFNFLFGSEAAEYILQECQKYGMVVVWSEVFGKLPLPETSLDPRYYTRNDSSDSVSIIDPKTTWALRPFDHNETFSRDFSIFWEEVRSYRKVSDPTGLNPLPFETLMSYFVYFKLITPPAYQRYEFFWKLSSDPQCSRDDCIGVDGYRRCICYSRTNQTRSFEES